MGPWLLQATVHLSQALAIGKYSSPPLKTAKVWGAPHSAPCGTFIVYMFTPNYALMQLARPQSEAPRATDEILSPLGVCRVPRQHGGVMVERVLLVLLRKRGMNYRGRVWFGKNGVGGFSFPDIASHLPFCLSSSQVPPLQEAK